MSYVAFVPARSGSKRLPDQNIKQLAGKPLIVWTLEAFAAAPAVDKVIFSTDSLEYWDIASRHIDPERLVLDLRSADDAGDKIKIFDYLKTRHRDIFKGDWTHFVMGLPTVPLRTSAHASEAIAESVRHGKPVFSACEYGFPVSFAFQVDATGDWAPVLEGNPMVTGNTRSQDQVKAYHPNGAIYVRPIADLADDSLRTLYDGARPYFMDRQDSADIDNEIDFLLAEAIIRKRTAAPE